jgi:thiamine biosynthesis protein ThiS
MKLVINGVVREAPELGCVADLASWLRLPAFGSAVELNGEVVREADHRGTALREGDRLEVVRLLGGG